MSPPVTWYSSNPAWMFALTLGDVIANIVTQTEEPTQQDLCRIPRNVAQVRATVQVDRG